MAQRSVTVRGVSDRDVTADLATWTVDFSNEGDALGPVQEPVNRQPMRTVGAHSFQKVSVVTTIDDDLG